MLVSSGAVGVGLLRMDMKEKPKTLRGRQAAAAVGQVHVRDGTCMRSSMECTSRHACIRGL